MRCVRRIWGGVEGRGESEEMGKRCMGIWMLGIRLGRIWLRVRGCRHGHGYEREGRLPT